jgi:hypothetical protein
MLKYIHKMITVHKILILYIWILSYYVLVL